ncbi:penicillin-binding protein transpeptidase domain protein [Ruminococcus sp. CAG:379]|uniref:penicillin-binding transpeptidase domain-containing protein n=1 Tax=Ruminococcus sp. CAG:379 TaxID=1262956 RepID=UPI00033EEB17|nr:penicillin-binding transpeptidase domain-containing protein [Ruminococcus sp. CAG:379]CDD52658.1 penicillin-binding protein transpeptidase domain protein [Ruminococcus sp. CAG:379]
MSNRDETTAQMKTRMNVWVLGAMMVLALAVIINLFKVSIIQNKEYQEMANNNHFGSITIPANRGSIYDANGKILAQSATVYKIYIDPVLFRKELSGYTQKETDRMADAAKNGESYTPVDMNAKKDELVQFLARTLDIKEETVREAMEKNTQYYVLKTQVEKPTADQILEYVNNIVVGQEVNKAGEIKDRTISFASITTESDTKRYYPQNSMAASVIGFTNSDGDGLYGLEALYDDYLHGTDGKTISAKDVNGNEMPYRYSKTYDAQDGNSLYLTIDTTLQTYLESNLAEMVTKCQVNNRACGIIMNAKTGAVLAMATYPGFDLNEPYVIADPAVQEYLDTLSEGEYKTAYVEAREKQWKNKAITELYQPGSVFKVITASAGFEESVIKLTDTFNCTGGVVVVDGVPPIHCSKRTGHGVQDFTTALTNSCNPAFMEIGKRLGATKFFQYFSAFGLTEKTGIDLPGEVPSYYKDLEDMGPVDLAVCSFGQTNIVTPIEMITAYAAAINGGYLMKPYVVSKVVDTDGNVIKTTEPEIRRQVVSEETSAIMRKALEDVVNNKGGSNAYIKGYRIGGKSGTSQKIGGSISSGDEDDMQYVASYACFAPADDPEIIMLIMADEPNKAITYYGSTVVVPYARKVLEKVLPYLGYYPEYTEEEQAKLGVKVPFLEDESVETAKSKLDSLGLKYEIVGEGENVYSQTPITGMQVPKGGTVILYSEPIETENTVDVPNVMGMKLSQANALLTSHGLNYVTAGASADRSDVTIVSQSLEPGSTVAKWSVMEIEFAVNDHQTG